jgi:hypothetical protein
LCYYFQIAIGPSIKGRYDNQAFYLTAESTTNSHSTTTTTTFDFSKNSSSTTRQQQPVHTPLSPPRNNSNSENDEKAKDIDRHADMKEKEVKRQKRDSNTVSAT